MFGMRSGLPWLSTRVFVRLDGRLTSMFPPAAPFQITKYELDKTKEEEAREKDAAAREKALAAKREASTGRVGGSCVRLLKKAGGWANVDLCAWPPSSGFT